MSLTQHDPSTPASPGDASAAGTLAPWVPPSEVPAAQTPAPPENADRRHAPRRTCVTEVFIRIDDDRAPREIHASTQDVSTRGMSFLNNQFLHTGTPLLVTLVSSPSLPLLTAQVVTCTYVGGGLHRVGVQFTARADAKLPEC